jgi:hypothetical protein
MKNQHLCQKVIEEVYTYTDAIQDFRSSWYAGISKDVKIRKGQHERSGMFPIVENFNSWYVETFENAQYIEKKLNEIGFCITKEEVEKVLGTKVDEKKLSLSGLLEGLTADSKYIYCFRFIDLKKKN